jgi:tetratricopeptide (TPR) repeat protein
MILGLPETHPISAMIRQKIQGTILRVCLEEITDVDVLETLADEAVERGDLDDAILSLTRAMSLRKDSLKRVKSSKDDRSTEQFQTACTLKKFGKVLVLKGDIPNADRAYKDALKLFKKSGMETVETLTAEQAKNVELV